MEDRQIDRRTLADGRAEDGRTPTKPRAMKGREGLMMAITAVEGGGALHGTLGKCRASDERKGTRSPPLSSSSSSWFNLRNDVRHRQSATAARWRPRPWRGHDRNGQDVIRYSAKIFIPPLGAPTGRPTDGLHVLLTGLWKEGRGRRSASSNAFVFQSVGVFIPSSSPSLPSRGSGFRPPPPCLPRLLGAGNPL